MVAFQTRIKGLFHGLFLLEFFGHSLCHNSNKIREKGPTNLDLVKPPPPFFYPKFQNCWCTKRALKLLDQLWSVPNLQVLHTESTKKNQDRPFVLTVSEASSQWQDRREPDTPSQHVPFYFKKFLPSNSKIVAK